MSSRLATTRRRLRAQRGLKLANGAPGLHGLTMIRSGTLLLLATLCACGDDSEGAFDGGVIAAPDASADAPVADTGADTTMPDGGPPDVPPFVGLSVLAEGVERLSDGRLYSVLDVRFENATGRSLPTTYMEFTVSDEDGIMQLGSELEFAGACSGSVPQGASRECRLAFDIVTGAVLIALQLHYTGPDGISAVAPIPPSCQRCGGVECIDLLTDVENCGGCGFTIGDALRCEGGAPVCEAGAVFEGDACTECAGPLCFPPHRLTEDGDAYVVVGMPPIACDDACALLGLGCVDGVHARVPTPNARYGAIVAAPDCNEAPEVEVGGQRLEQTVCTCE